MINREATIRWKGYDPDDLAPNSHLKVWAVCERFLPRIYNQKLSVHHVRYNKDSLCDDSEQVFVPL